MNLRTGIYLFAIIIFFGVLLVIGSLIPAPANAAMLDDEAWLASVAARSRELTSGKAAS